MKFICDQMFGTLASWLRLLGFDTFYTAEEITDENILRIASNEDRILITRDKEMVFHAKKKLVSVLYLESTDLDEQLFTVLTHTDAKINDDLVLTLCSICNACLHQVEKKRIAEQVPRKVIEFQDEFFECMQCGKIYWKGSHYQKICAKIQSIKKQVENVK
jgi:hypothetical protein